MGIDKPDNRENRLNTQDKQTEQQEITQKSIGEILLKEKNNDYFNGKSHEFNVSETQANSNSEMMDKITEEIDYQNKEKKLIKLGEEINKQYKQATGEDLNLSEEQLQSIIEAHNLEGELGKLSQKELKEKVETLKKTIKDSKIIRFLLEAGFCGSSLINYLNKIIFKNILTKEQLSILETDSESFYEGYNYSDNEIQANYHHKRARILENIKTYIDSVIEENRDIGNTEIIKNIRPDLVTLPILEKTKIILLIDKIVKKHNAIRKYLNFNEGPYNSPKELLCAMIGIKNPKIIKNINDNITVKQHGLGLTFFVPNEESFKIIYKKVSKGYNEAVAGFNYTSSKIPELKQTLSVIRGNNMELEAILHEGQHNWNSYFMPDKAFMPRQHIAAAKDEIIAYLSTLTGINEIEQILTLPANKTYKYNLEGKARENHKNQVKKLIGYAKDLIELSDNLLLTRKIIIQMLSDTPRKKREELHPHILNAVNSSINTGFRRTGIAKKETEINEISNAKSIKEIKHILNNPRYSHIPRGQDRKGGIEISSIIDKITEGNEELITQIPTEIRTQIQKFIKKQ